MSKTYSILRPIASLILRTLFKIKVEGKENIPKGPFIIAANHNDSIDPAPLVYALKKNIYFLASDYLFHPPIRTRHLIKYTNQIPLKRGNSTGVLNKVNQEYLQKGKIFAIFPEGTIEGGKTILEPKTGVARMALLSKKPVLPIAINGTYGILPIRENPIWFRKFPKIKVTIGKPMTFEKYKTVDKTTLKQIAKEIMQEISKMYQENYEEYENQERRKFIEIERPQDIITTEQGDLIIPGKH